MINGTQRKVWMLVAVTVAAVGLASAGAVADTISFKQGVDGYTGTQDNALFYYTNYTTRNYGGSTLIDAGPSVVGSSIKRSVISFDLSSFDMTNVTVDSVTLRLSVSGTYNATTGTTYTVGAYAISQDNAGWAQGTANNTPQTGSSCWDYLAYSSTAWVGGGGLGDPGDGYASTPIATATWVKTTTGDLDLTFTGTSAELTALIASFTSSSTNAGLLLRSTDENVAGMLRVNSSETADAPELIVNYSVPEPATMALLGIGGVMMLVRRRR